jgi:hypothetical protein
MVILLEWLVVGWLGLMDEKKAEFIHRARFRRASMNSLEWRSIYDRPSGRVVGWAVVSLSFDDAPHFLEYFFDVLSHLFDGRLILAASAFDHGDTLGCRRHLDLVHGLLLADADLLLHVLVEYLLRESEVRQDGRLLADRFGIGYCDCLDDVVWKLTGHLFTPMNERALRRSAPNSMAHLSLEGGVDKYRYGICSVLLP